MDNVLKIKLPTNNTHFKVVTYKLDEKNENQIINIINYNHTNTDLYLVQFLLTCLGGN